MKFQITWRQVKWADDSHELLSIVESFSSKFPFFRNQLFLKNLSMFLTLLPNWIKLQNLSANQSGVKLTFHLHLEEKHFLR